MATNPAEFNKSSPTPPVLDTNSTPPTSTALNAKTEAVFEQQLPVER
jgi:hypothetical protein